MDNLSVSHDRRKESPEAKARWFQRLSLQERMDLLCFYTDLILTNNPDIIKEKDAQSAGKRVQVTSTK